MDKIATIRQIYNPDGINKIYQVSIWHNKRIYSANTDNIALIKTYQTDPITYQETVNRKNANKALINFVKHKNNLK